MTSIRIESIDGGWEVDRDVVHSLETKLRVLGGFRRRLAPNRIAKDHQAV